VKHWYSARSDSGVCQRIQSPPDLEDLKRQNLIYCCNITQFGIRVEKGEVGERKRKGRKGVIN
jgi:predicted GH43/DUF377 family glycosyl hydrolase